MCWGEMWNCGWGGHVVMIDLMTRSQSLMLIERISGVRISV